MRLPYTQVNSKNLSQYQRSVVIIISSSFLESSQINLASAHCLIIPRHDANSITVPTVLTFKPTNLPCVTSAWATSCPVLASHRCR